MTIDHRKVVTLTTYQSPYVEIINNTNGYQVTDTVTRYTKPVYLSGAGGGLFGDAALDLKLATSLSLTDAVSGNNLVTFSRASAGTYVGSDGLIKNSPVNLLTYSEQFDIWSKTRATIISDALVSPSGQLDASKLNVTTDSGSHTITRTVTGGRNTASIYAKAGEYDGIQITGTNTAGDNACFNLTNGTAYHQGSNVTDINIEDVGDGWYRCSARLPLGNGSFYIAVTDGVTTAWLPSFTGSSASDGIYIWGAQVEEGSTATTYIPTTTTIGGAPRFDHDPATGESLGLLIEGSRTNLLTYSEEFDNAAWELSRSTINPNSAVSPGGTANADKIVWVINETTHGFITQGSTDRGAATNPIVSYTLTGSGTATVFSTLATGSNYGIDPIGNGWYRCWLYDSTADQTLSVYAKAGEFDTMHLQFYNTNRYIYVRDSVAAQGDGTSGIYIWGAQVEAGSFPTSYIPTTDSAVTRAADNVSIEGTNFSSWYNQSEGTFFAEASRVVGNANPRLFVTTNGINTRTVDVVKSSPTQLSAVIGGVGTSGYGGYTEPFTLTAAYKADDYAGSLNGVLAFTSVSGSVPTCNSIILGNYYSGSYYQNGHISRLSYFPTRKPDEDLTSLTLPTVITYGITSPGGVFNLRATGIVDYEVDWELTGSREASTEGVLPHTYTAGNHTLAVYSDRAYRPFVSNVTADASQITSVVIGSGAYLGTNLQNAWWGATNMTSFVCPFDVTSGVTSFYQTWQNCSSLASFPLIDVSSTTGFYSAWRECSSLTSFPLIDTSLGVNFTYTWYNCTNLTSFPLIDTSSGTGFSTTWANCSSLTSFPLIDTSSGTNFNSAWFGCTNLANFPANMFDTTGTLVANAFYNTWNGCALTAQSIENILVSLDTNGATGISLGINGGTNAVRPSWSGAAVTAYDNLMNKGWTIAFNS